ISNLVVLGSTSSFLPPTFTVISSSSISSLLFVSSLIVREILKSLYVIVVVPCIDIQVVDTLVRVLGRSPILGKTRPDLKPLGKGCRCIEVVLDELDNLGFLGGTE